jgi:hypothetical protein
VLVDRRIRAALLFCLTGNVDGCCNALVLVVCTDQPQQVLLLPAVADSADGACRLCRSPNHIPGANVATYYGQRASPGGLIISEATAICPEAHG